MPLLSLIILFLKLMLQALRTVWLPTPQLKVPSPAIPLPLRAARATGTTNSLGTTGAGQTSAGCLDTSWFRACARVLMQRDGLPFLPSLILGHVWILWLLNTPTPSALCVVASLDAAPVPGEKRKAL